MYGSFYNARFLSALRAVTMSITVGLKPGGGGLDAADFFFIIGGGGGGGARGRADAADDDTVYGE